ncbi:MAG: LapA family protein [Akkermansiaceae bacterium]|nr:LapA family protein [Akkermansiaceae bacterium]NNM29734.1 LapA family protein [Akkermansiaceae bacterium]
MTDEQSAPRKRPVFRLVAVGIAGVVALILVLQNTDNVETRLLFTTVTMPRAVLLLITFLLGIIVGLLVAFLRKRKQ